MGGRCAYATGMANNKAKLKISFDVNQKPCLSTISQVRFKGD